MKPTIKKMWIDALLSGKYKQGKGMLKSPLDKNGGHKFCCLGVLCDLYNETHARKLKESPGKTTHDQLNCILVDGEWGYLPPRVVAWAGLESQDPMNGVLTAENDAGRKFTSIANLIEEEL